MKPPIGATAMTLQYVSVVIIVLAVVLGALSSPTSKSTELTSPVDMQVRLGALQISSVFSTDGEEVVENQELQGIVTALASHDLEAVIEVGANVPPKDTSVPTEQALARSMALYRYFITQGIPSEVVRVFAVPQGTGNSISVVITRAPTAGGSA